MAPLETSPSPHFAPSRTSISKHSEEVRQVFPRIFSTQNGRVEQTVEALNAAGMTYESDGALWLRTSKFGDDKDRVMRSDGTFTYFLPDVAYHVTKWERGFHRAIDVQGADHHSTTTRVRAGLQALNMGIAEGYPEYVLHQMVTVMRSGEEVKISKRAGSCDRSRPHQRSRSRCSAFLLPPCRSAAGL